MAVTPDDHQLHYEVTADRTLITGKDVSLSTLPMMDWLGLPMTGAIDVALDVKGTKDLAHANGTIRITCPANCRLGDDKATLKPQLKSSRNAAFMVDGIRFGHIDFDSVSIAIDIVDGKASITKWDFSSKDLKLAVAGAVTLGKTMAVSTANLCVRFAATPALKARDPSMDALVPMTGATMATDGMFNIQVEGPLLDAKRRGVICDGSAPPLAHRESTMDTESAPPPDDATTAKLLASLAKKVSDTKYVINRVAWEQVLANPMAVTRGARLVPSAKDGKAIGFRLYAVVPDSMFDRLGLQDGDLIRTVNGFSVASADLALEAYTKLRKATLIELELDRNGAPMTIRYQLK